MTTDDVVNYDEIVCPHCGKVMQADEIFPIVPGMENLFPDPSKKTLEFGSKEEMEEFFKPQEVQPRKYTYWIDHRVEVTIGGWVDRVEAVEQAIAYVRKYMATLPEGYRLVQACPKHIATVEGHNRRTWWKVRCILYRKSDTMDLEWAHLLDKPEEGKMP